MRVNIYAEEMTDRVEIVEKVIKGQTFTGLRIYLYLPITSRERVCDGPDSEGYEQNLHLKGPFIRSDGDDDSSAVTFWGKTDLRDTLIKALHMLDRHYAERRNNEIMKGRT